MNYLLIRTYEKDDYIARLCYESWMLAGYSGKVIFLSEGYETKWLKGIGETVIRDKVANFGGQLGANCLRKAIRDLKVNYNDTIITCDTDVIIKENPLVYHSFDLVGVGEYSKHGFYHVSGQCMIMKGYFANKIANQTEQEFQQNWKSMDEKGISINDDSYFSYHSMRTLLFSRGRWLHEKMYHLEPRTDWENIINELSC